MSWQYAPACDVPIGWVCRHPTHGLMERTKGEPGDYNMVRFIPCDVPPTGFDTQLRADTMVWVRVPT